MFIKIALMLGYLIFSTICMFFGCMMQAAVALKTIAVVWLAVSMLIFILVSKYMRHQVYISGNTVDSSAETEESGIVNILTEKKTEDIFEGYELTKRELEILQQICHGKTNTQIADTLYISESTVKTHISNTYRKLGVRNRTEAICLVNSHGNID